ncbi:MAG: hypothetical protein WCE98_04890 [Chlorobium sp.]
MATVLLLAGHTIQALPVMRSLKHSGHKVIIECETKSSYGYYSRYSDRKILNPGYPYDSEAYLDFVLGILKEYEVDVLLPLFDPSAEFVSLNSDRLRDRVLFAVPPYEVFMRGYSKNRLMDLCRDNEIPHPRTIEIDMNNVEKSCEYTGFPALIKPDITTGGRGMVLVMSSAEVEKAFPDIQREYGSCTLQEFIPAGGRQFKAHHFRTAAGSCIASVVVEKTRYYPEHAGSSCCNRTVDFPEIIRSTSQALHLLGWEGFADFDLIEDPRDGRIKIMEINPRFPASIRSAFEAGVDYARIYVDYCLGNPLQEYTCRPGVCLRYLGLDLLWFIKSKNRFRTEPSWFRFFGRDVYYQEGSLKDPLPFVFGTYSGIKKLMDQNFRKSKSGVQPE